MLSDCPRCGKSIFTYEGAPVHRCLPIFLVFDPIMGYEEDDEEGWKKVHARDHESAAREYAEEADQRWGDGPTEREGLKVKDENGRIQTFDTCYETTIVYRATES